MSGSRSVDVLEVIPRGREQIVFNFGGSLHTFETDNFTQQHRFWKSSGRLDNWDHELLHLKSPAFASFFYLYKKGYRKLFLDGGLFSLIEGQFERKIVYQILEQLRTFGGCNVHILEGKYGSSFSPPTYTNIVDSEKVFLDLSINQYDKFDYLMEGRNKSPVFLNKNINYDFENLISTSVVGNSNSILDEKNKETIESNQCVVRINDAPCEGFEQYVGGKTDFRFVNNLLVSGKKIDGEFNLSSINDLCGERLIFDVQDDSKIIEIAKSFGSKNELYFISEKFSKEMKSLADVYNLNKLSSGLKVTLLFGTLSNKVELFGFDFYDSASLHYWEDINKENVDRTHNWEKEKEVFDYLSKNFSVKIAN